MFSYIGVDISGAMLAKARERYGHDDRVQFIEGDILNLDLKHAGIDFAVESGAFTYRVKDNWQLMYDSLHRMFDIAHKGVAANFMTSYVDYELPKNFHYAPEKVLSFCKQLTRYVNLIHDYPLYEFTVQIFK
jgi:SAM-dependent methyltransferase